ncbi:DNA-directed RNA polymerase subunit D [Candidatus Woesearchaeota archaeon]|nr:DNA-directed RNA polymerase subunit D [Candidatus Woesearchaeota archaeon]
MEIRMLERDKEAGKLSFILKGSTPAFANALRRLITEEVPVMAIEDVELRKNNSILYDEMVAHRLGLVPLTTDLKSYNLPRKCKCKGEGCARCQLKMTLKAKGPAVVYASDIKSKDSAIKPVYPKLQIVKLLKGQDVEVEATAMLGQGKEHMKWSPGLVYYKYKPSIELGSVKNPESVVEACPVDIFELKEGKLTINKDKLLSCHLCEACVDADEGIKLNYDNTEFVFYVESWGQLDPKKMVIEAAKLLGEQLDELASDIAK